LGFLVSGSARPAVRAGNSVRIRTGAEQDPRSFMSRHHPACSLPPPKRKCPGQLPAMTEGTESAPGALWLPLLPGRSHQTAAANRDLDDSQWDCRLLRSEEA